MCVSHLLRGRAVHSHSSDMQWCGVRPVFFFLASGLPCFREGGEGSASRGGDEREHCKSNVIRNARAHTDARAHTIALGDSHALTATRTDGVYGLEQCPSSAACECFVAGKFASPAGLCFPRQRIGWEK